MNLWNLVETYGKLAAVAGISSAVSTIGEGVSGDSFFGRNALGLSKGITSGSSVKMPDVPEAAYVGGTSLAQLSSLKSRQLATQLERLMNPRNQAMRTGVEALANSYIRNALATSNKITNRALTTEKVSTSPSSETIGLGSETLKV